MKTIVKINLTDGERRRLADVVDGKQTKRLITRAEIIDLCKVYVDGLVASAEHRANNSPGGRNYVTRGITESSAYKPDPYQPDAEDTEHLSGRSSGHIYGWNKVKNEKLNWK